jgi:tetratricopeptide (TPR) repeat protein
MKKLLNGLVSLPLLLFVLTATAQKEMAQKKTEQKEMAKGKKMTWTTISEAARQLADKGAKHHRNIEFEQAYDNFSSALQLDPDFTVALVFMTTMTNGETKKMYAKRALESAANKTEGEKLLASLVDEKNTEETRRDIWAKLHEMFPDGAMIGHYYVVSRATPEERFDAAQAYINKFPQEAAMYNMIAYYYMTDKKDNDMAKKNFEKYIELYPEGSNPYDSMGEFYATTGDVANSEKYYAKSLEKYPFNNNAITALKKMEDDKKKNTVKKD